MNNKGYYDSSKWPFREPEPPKQEIHLVICNNCNATWREEMPALTSIAGYARRYDFCSLCEQQYTKNHGRMSPLNLKAYGIGLDPKDNPKLGNFNPKIPSGLERFKPPNWANQQLDDLIDRNGLWADSANGEII